MPELTWDRLVSILPQSGPLALIILVLGLLVLLLRGPLGKATEERLTPFIRAYYPEHALAAYAGLLWLTSGAIGQWVSAAAATAVAVTVILWRLARPDSARSRRALAVQGGTALALPLLAAVGHEMIFGGPLRQGTAVVTHAFRSSSWERMSEDKLLDLSQSFRDKLAEVYTPVFPVQPEILGEYRSYLYPHGAPEGARPRFRLENEAHWSDDRFQLVCKPHFPPEDGFSDPAEWIRASGRPTARDYVFLKAALGLLEWMGTREELRLGDDQVVAVKRAILGELLEFWSDAGLGPPDAPVTLEIRSLREADSIPDNRMDALVAEYERSGASGLGGESTGNGRLAQLRNLDSLL